MKKRFNLVHLFVIMFAFLLLALAFDGRSDRPETRLRDIRSACERQGGQLIASFKVPSGDPLYESDNYCLYPRKEK